MPPCALIASELEGRCKVALDPLQLIHKDPLGICIIAAVHNHH